MGVVPDYRWAGPTSKCLCGSADFNLHGGFDEHGSLAWWGLDAECSGCGALVRVPCPPDLEGSNG